MPSLLFINEPSRIEIFTISSSKHLRHSVLSLDNKTNEPPTIHHYQATDTIYRYGHDDQKVSLSSLEFRPGVQRGGIVRSSNDFIMMNPPGTTKGNVPQRTGQGGLNLYDSIAGILYSSNRSASWNSAAITENAGCNSLKKHWVKE